METDTMKSQISFIAMGLVVATTALGFATAGRLPALIPHATVPVRVAEAAGTGVPRRVYCYSGIKGEPGRLYRGWICLPEHPPTLTN
jgi:hypothetical protein